MVSEDSHHQPVEAARTFNIHRTANDRGCHSEGRANGEGGEDQIRVSLESFLCLKLNILSFLTIAAI